jgi:pyrroline-5-carboxylate reductase
MKIAFIGGGNMGEAMLAAILGKGLSRPASVCVSDVKEERRRYLKSKYGVAVTESNKQAAENKDVVILAVKPQNLTEVMVELYSSLKPAQLVLSIVAGAKTETICRGLDHGRVVRAMPNTPARIGAGISAWTATASVSEKQKGWAKAILAAMGQEIYFDDEPYLDMATAVSGSGPAYFFFFVESVIDAAEHIGFSRDVAQALVLQTMLGSAQLLQKSGEPAGELRRKVTSPGGTTAAAIKILEEGRFSDLIREAVRAACNRARELGK